MTAYELPRIDRRSFKLGASGQVADLLRTLILDGTFRAEEPLPSEAALRVMTGAGRNVVRAALDQLRRDGFVSRRPGRGTIVRSRRAVLRLDRPTGISGSFDGGGHRVVTRFRSLVELVPPSFLAERLELGLGERCLAIDYETSVDSEPYAVATSYLPAERGREHFDADLAGVWLGDWYHVLAGLGFALGHIDLRIEACVADGDLAETLDIDVGAPIFRFERLVLDADGHPLDYGFSRCRADRVVLGFEITGGQR